MKQLDGSTGLDLCSLQNVGDSDVVGLDVQFLLEGDIHTLSYVTQCSDIDGNPDPASFSQKVTVTRTGVLETDGVDEWIVEGDTGCLRAGDIWAGQFLWDVTAPFFVTLKVKAQ